MVAYGIRTVVDVRDPREFAQDLDPFHPDGMWAGEVAYVSAPLISEAEWDAIRYPQVLRRGYTVTFELSRSNIAGVLRAIAAAPTGGVVVHCHAGKERTGVVAALLLALAGVADDYVASDLHLAPLYEHWAAREPDPAKRSEKLRSFASRPEHILVPLRYLRECGGVGAYLHEAGLEDAQLEAVRRRLVGDDRSQPSRR
jgi:hypothetical protein